MKTFDLKEFRKSNTTLNQEDFADKLGCSQTYISKIENGSKSITPALLKTIGKVFKVSTDEYLPLPESGKAIKGTVQGKHSTLKYDDAELEKKYYRLLEEKIKTDDRYFELTEKYATLESSMLQENNRLLKQIDADNKKILRKLEKLEK